MFWQFIFAVSVFGKILFYFFFYYEKSRFYKNSFFLQIPLLILFIGFFIDYFFVKSLPENKKFDFLIGGLIAHALLAIVNYVEGKWGK
jgi:hypothetical protein